MPSIIRQFFWLMPYQYLRVFAKVRKATSSFVTSVRLEQLGSHWTDFDETSYLRLFRKSVEKLQVSLKSDKK